MPRSQKQNSKEYFTLNEATRANLNKNKRILEWEPFWNKVYSELQRDWNETLALHFLLDSSVTAQLSKTSTLFAVFFVYPRPQTYQNRVPAHLYMFHWSCSILMKFSFLVCRFYYRNHRNYNFLDCDWFKKLLFSTNSLAKLLSNSLLLDSSMSQSH